MWEGVPLYVSVIVFFVFMCLVGMMEGMQIALFAVVNLPKEDLNQYTIVTICMFIVARITTLNVEIGEDENVFGVSDDLQNFFNTGLLGAMVTTSHRRLFGMAYHCLTFPRRLPVQPVDLRDHPTVFVA
jgi:Na+/H+-translocating membrane pyrophosphatase